MSSFQTAIKASLKKTRNLLQSLWMSYPKNVQCNVCQWEGRQFLGNSWHKQIVCPNCRSQVRQRLFLAALEHISDFSWKKTINKKRILHFAPEELICSIIRPKASQYNTADFLRLDCDLKLDMSNMPEISDQSIDVVIAFDVLEHVPNYHKAIEEIHRILSPEGFAILTVPQKDNLATTYEDPAITTPEDRLIHFGQVDHLRIFGDDFPKIVGSKGFSVTTVEKSSFTQEIAKKYVLFPPIFSKQPLATNFPKVFFCQK
ncbi:MAG: class I SAM-dependent methyltransferase [Microcystaceae cyanobacterium]